MCVYIYNYISIMRTYFVEIFPLHSPYVGLMYRKNLSGYADAQALQRAFKGNKTFSLLVSAMGTRPQPGCF